MIVLDIAAAVLILAGSLFCVIGGIGLVRMPDFYTRIHAASVTDTLIRHEDEQCVLKQTSLL